MAAAEPAADDRYAYVELIGGADGCATCLLLAVGRRSADLARTRDACYALRGGEGCVRLAGACGASLARLRAVACCAPADALGVPELALACRGAGAGRSGRRRGAFEMPPRGRPRRHFEPRGRPRRHFEPRGRPVVVSSRADGPSSFRVRNENGRVVISDHNQKCNPATAALFPTPS